MPSVENEEYRKCRVWKMRSIENAECGKCGMRKMRSVESASIEPEVCGRHNLRFALHVLIFRQKMDRYLAVAE